MRLMAVEIDVWVPRHCVADLPSSGPPHHGQSRYPDRQRRYGTERDPGNRLTGRAGPAVRTDIGSIRVGTADTSRTDQILT